MDAITGINDEQTKLWNGLAGRAWVEAQDLLDGMFQPFQEMLVDIVSHGSGGRVLDVGCGTGSTTIAVARLLGARGICTGIDISEPMISAARTRAKRESNPARFICADAQVHPFEPDTFDTIISRFGVMFFADPIAAFRNLRRAAKHGAELHVIAWRSAAENPFMTAAERAAAPLLPDLPDRRADAPGQFAFANGQRVRSILETSGWTAIDLRPVDIACSLSEAELVPYITQLGPVGRLLQEQDESNRTRIVELVRPAFDPYVHEAEVRYTAACWLVSAIATPSRVAAVST